MNEKTGFQVLAYMIVSHITPELGKLVCPSVTELLAFISV